MSLHILIDLLGLVTRRHHQRASRPGLEARRVGAARSGRYPVGAFPVPTGSRLVVVTCAHCGGELGLTRWEHWNGFLVTCPHCGETVGKTWNLGSIVSASLLLNALSFFFTMRPRAAAGAAFVHAVFAVAGGLFVSRFEQIDALLVTYFLILFFVPLVVNLFLFMNHEALV